MWPKTTHEGSGLTDKQPVQDYVVGGWKHRDWIDMQNSLDDWLEPILRNITNKLTLLRNLISEKGTDDIGYSEYTKADVDWEMVNDWLNNTLSHEIYPSKQTLTKANKLWREYNK
jgi:hypothetical protein